MSIEHEETFTVYNDRCGSFTLLITMQMLEIIVPVNVVIMEVKEMCMIEEEND